MSDETEVLMSVVLSFTMRRDPPNDPGLLKARVEAARTKYLCHPENRVRKVWGGPVRGGGMG